MDEFDERGRRGRPANWPLRLSALTCVALSAAVLVLKTLPPS